MATAAAITASGKDRPSADAKIGEQACDEKRNTYIASRKLLTRY